MIATCKKEYFGDRVYRKNKSYIIYPDKYITERDKKSGDYDHFIITDEYRQDNYKIKGRWFNKKEFEEYFYTPQEVRIEKLKKLKNENNCL
jgi:hypothetical protein